MSPRIARRLTLVLLICSTGCKPSSKSTEAPDATTACTEKIELK